MLSLFNQMASTMDPEEICNNSGFHPSLPMHVHCKDLKGRYIASNERVLLDAGFHNNEDDLYGRTDDDLDFLNEGEAESFKAIDKFILTTEKTHFFTQSVTLADGITYIAMNHKTPLRSKQNNVIGVLSYGTITKPNYSAYFDPKYPMFNLLFSANSHLLESLSPRQIDCLYFLVRGFTVKEIAKQISLSPRTVEHYLETIKDKFGCKKRPEIIDKIMSTFI